MGKPDFTGNSNISAQTLNQLDVGIKANQANQLDLDINNVDVNSSSYVSDEINISGSQELVAGITPTGACNLVIEWTDGNGNVQFAETFSQSSETKHLVTTASTHVIVKIEDTSGSSNPVDATVNGH